MNGPRGLAPSELAWVTVDLDAVVENFERVRAHAGVDVFAVVKADAYGHGAVEVARALGGRSGLLGLVVARTGEAEALRAAGIVDDIVVLTPGLAASGDAAGSLRRLSAARLSPYLASLADVEAAVGAASSLSVDSPVDVHLEVDTGMARAGVAGDEVGSALEALRRTPALRLRGIATHFAESEVAGSGLTVEQIERFREALGSVQPEPRPPLLVHAANSVAALDVSAARFDAVRCGGALYGLDLAAQGNRRSGGARLAPAMSVTARVVQVRALRTGQPVGYGSRWRAPRDTRIALVPIGYADGYPSQVGDRARVVLHGRRCAVVGAVSMDLITVDLAEAPCAPGDEVVVLGAREGEAVDAAELANAGGGVLYEVTCRFSRRLPRRFEAPKDREVRAPGRRP